MTTSLHNRLPMAPVTKRIAIIGGGISGMASIVACKENGMEPVCFEQTDKFGGTWCYREESAEGIPSIMSSTIINVSKELTAFSTFPPKKEYNNFMRHEEMYRYLTDFATSHDIQKHMNYNSEVTQVKRAEDYDFTGKWEVTVWNSWNHKKTTEIFDGVMVCIGHINRPKMPHFPDQDVFKGKTMHTHTLKRVNEFRDKNVVVVGIGCSGLDAATESSNVAKQVYLSTRSGAHIMSRTGAQGYPMDYSLLRRYMLFSLQILPVQLVSWFLESVYLDPLFDHRLYAVKPKRPFLCQDPSINDQIGSKLLSGSVIQKPDIERFTENGVIFKGEASETKADVVIMATGYSWAFPFLEDDVIIQDAGKISLYKCVFPSHLQHGTLAIIGFILPLGPGIPLMELQLRWAATVLSGRGKLPSADVMLKDIDARYRRNLKRYDYSDKLSIRVDHLEYMDDIASLLGVMPNLLKYFFTDYKLFRKLMFGPALSYQYRLQGPHRWEGAREAIMTTAERVHWPLQKRIEKRESFFMRFFKRMLKMLFSC